MIPPKRSAKKIFSNIFGIIVALIFFVATGAKSFQATPTGVQCPTAPVQVTLRPIISKCGHVVGYESAKPRPGDKSFVQCHCAEKTSTEKLSSVPPRTELFVCSIEAPAWPVKLVTPRQLASHLFRLDSILRSPLLRPPTIG